MLKNMVLLIELVFTWEKVFFIKKNPYLSMNFTRFSIAILKGKS